MSVFRTSPKRSCSRFRHLANDETSALKVSFDGFEEGGELAVQHGLSGVFFKLKWHNLPTRGIALGSFPT